jgi:hypothetical protein
MFWGICGSFKSANHKSKNLKNIWSANLLTSVDIPGALSNGAEHHCALSYTEKNNVCVLKSLLCHWQLLSKLFLASLQTTAYVVKKPADGAVCAVANICTRSR